MEVTAVEDQVSQQLTNILTSASYQQKLKEVKEAVEECTSNIQQVANLNYGKAKQLSYYAASTYKLDELDLEPILTLLAGSGSGKNEVMQVLMQYVHKANWVTVSDEMSKATLRDELNSSHLGTALVEEADTVPEGLLTRRPYRVSGPLSVYKPHETAKGNAPYFPRSYNVFGATILHRRIEFRDNAVRRRALIVRWRHLKPEEMEKQGLAFRKANTLTYTKSMTAITDISLPNISGLSNSLKGISNITLDLWQESLQIALLCSDYDWVNGHAIPAMKVESDEIEKTMDVEPSALVFRVLLSQLARDRNVGIPDKLKPVTLVDIGKALHNDYRRDLAEKQIAPLYRAAGLELKNSGGYTKVYPTRESLKQAARIVGVEDEMIDKIDEWEEWNYGK